MGNSIRVVVKCKSQSGEGKVKEHEIGKFSFHRLIEIRMLHLRKKIENYRSLYSSEMSSVKHFSMKQRDDMSGLHCGYRFLDAAYRRIDGQL